MMISVAKLSNQDKAQLQRAPPALPPALSRNLRLAAEQPSVLQRRPLRLAVLQPHISADPSQRLRVEEMGDVHPISDVWGPSEDDSDEGLAVKLMATTAAVLWSEVHLYRLVRGDTTVANPGTPAISIKLYREAKIPTPQFDVIVERCQREARAIIDE